MSAGDGREAIEMVAKHQPRLVLMAVGEENVRDFFDIIEVCDF